MREDVRRRDEMSSFELSKTSRPVSRGVPFPSFDDNQFAEGKDLMQRKKTPLRSFC